MSAITFYTKLEHYTNTKGGNGEITITPSSNFVLSQVTKNGGSPSEINSYSISGSSVVNNSLEIATVKVSVTNTSTKMFNKSPYIKNNKYRLQLTSVERTGAISGSTKGRITAYNFNLIYTHLVSSTVDDATTNTARIYFKQLDVVKKYDGDVRHADGSVVPITSFEWGTSNVHFSGESRILKIHGIPKAEFVIGCQDEDGNSILDITQQTSSLVGYGTSSHLGFRGTIPDTGVFKFKLNIPSAYVRATQTTTTNSSVSKFVVNNLSNVKAGDIIYSQLPKNSKIQTNIGGDANNECTKTVVSVVDPDGDNPNELSITGRTLTNTVANYPIGFVRPKQYFLILTNVGVVAQSGSGVGVNPLVNEYIVLSQKIDPIVSFDFTAPSEIAMAQLTTSNSKTELETNTPRNTSFSGGDPLKLSFRGIANRDSVGSNTLRGEFWIKIKMTIGGKTFSSLTNPKYSNFSNTDWRLNGGTYLRLKESSWTGLGSNTGFLTLGFNIDRYGDADINFELPIANIYEGS